MKSFLSYLQHDAMDCGPTCLRMIAAHYGRIYSLEGLREKSHISRESVSMRGISKKDRFVKNNKIREMIKIFGKNLHIIIFFHKIAV
jgi:ABC-type bacteriocin/lantibiotic exporter with double-glycine peptidase domain